MLRYALIFLAAFVTNAFAGESQNTPKEAHADVAINEHIVHRGDLATHMGWSGAEAVFKAPRNFHSQQLNEFRLETDEDSVEPITN